MSIISKHLLYKVNSLFVYLCNNLVSNCDYKKTCHRTKLRAERWKFAGWEMVHSSMHSQFRRFKNISYKTRDPVALSQETEANFPHFTRWIERRVSPKTDVTHFTLFIERWDSARADVAQFTRWTKRRVSHRTDMDGVKNTTRHAKYVQCELRRVCASVAVVKKQWVLTI